MFATIGAFVKARVLARTAAGVDFESKPFEPYSPRYALFRKEQGHPTNKVNLFFTGSMLGSMDYFGTTDSVRIFIRPGQDRMGVSNPAKASWLSRKRQFMALSEEDRVLMLKVASKALLGGDKNKRGA